MRYLIGIVVALGIGLATYGAAATVSVNGGTIQAGEDTNLVCTEQANVLGWGLETDDGLVYSVRIGVNDDCVGNAIFVSITETGTEIASGSLDPIPAGGNCDPDPAGQVCVRIPFTPQPAEDITDIHIFIEGPGGTPDP
jgi:hypothetical protein